MKATPIPPRQPNSSESGHNGRSSAMVALMPRYRFSIEDYERMGTTGILGEDDRVELIQGDVIAMSPIGPRHNDTLAMFNRLIVPRVSSEVLVLVQGAIRLPSDSEPQPDL